MCNRPGAPENRGDHAVLLTFQRFLTMKSHFNV